MGGKHFDDTPQPPQKALAQAQGGSQSRVRRVRGGEGEGGGEPAPEEPGMCVRGGGGRGAWIKASRHQLGGLVHGDDVACTTQQEEPCIARTT